jgi:hypothetical protein
LPEPEAPGFLSVPLGGSVGFPHVFCIWVMCDGKLYVQLRMESELWLQSVYEGVSRRD